ncbi:Tripartite ATP-independent periplasmic transporter, DctQ component [Pseudovibrio sp. Ad46]|uniref:TRAP transporter small permease n=1 Tax=unclassified Pseudovibrio TaxID=2627060 RepID=UPI0007AE64DF|nr:MULTISPECIES: TRAP transporter small permease [unclassified Pseudovibrio]KZK88577.1 Tripartite ATP-independent periplasmic transporter, DctQ component [Pseudovibrio sp. Ad46]KZK91201.1 Tripartite ATP-independent periplasmic transporter, DctQ component [Pseudovibrio sp. Ad5]
MLPNKLKKLIDLLIAAFSVSVMALLVVCVTWQVVSRYILGQPSTFTDEIARFAMIWVGLLGGAYCVGAQRHLAIDLFTGHLTGRKKLLFTAYSNFLVGGFAAATMIFGGLRLLLKVQATGQLSPAMLLPMEYIYLVLPLSGGVIVIYSLHFTIEALRGLLGLDKVKSSVKPSFKLEQDGAA